MVILSIDNLQVVDHNHLLLIHVEHLLLLLLLMMRRSKLRDIKVCRLDALSNLIERTHAHMAYSLIVRVMMIVFLNTVNLALARTYRLTKYPWLWNILQCIREFVENCSRNRSYGLRLIYGYVSVQHIPVPIEVNWRIKTDWLPFHLMTFRLKIWYHWAGNHDWIILLLILILIYLNERYDFFFLLNRAHLLAWCCSIAHGSLFLLNPWIFRLRCSCSKRAIELVEV